MLQVSMQDAASFLVIISGAANDIALRSGRPQSQQSIEYKSQAMALVNKRMSVSQSYFTDGTINACSMFAGTEVSPPSHCRQQLMLTRPVHSFYLAPQKHSTRTWMA